MYYRTRTYLAGDWDGDKDLIQKIYEWKRNGYLSLDFTDAHDLTQSMDSSLNCTIKDSLSKRMNASKTFVLIVGDKTASVMSGSCRYCDHYSSYLQHCTRGHSVDWRSYVKYECEKAARDARNGYMRIVVIYNYMTVHKEKCPEAVRNLGIHVPGIYRDRLSGNQKFDYWTIKKAMMGQL